MSDDFALQQIKRTIDDLSYQLAEAQRQLQLVSGVMGTVVSWDPKTHTAVVDLGYETHAIPVADAPGDFTPLAKGQLVHVYAPSGRLENAYLRPAGYSGQQKPPANTAGVRVMSLPGGGQFKSLTGKIAHVEAGSITQFVLVLGDQKFTIKPEALNPA
jgi:hypothetical protein